jgi:hypothetical protein
METKGTGNARAGTSSLWVRLPSEPKKERRLAFIGFIFKEKRICFR